MSNKVILMLLSFFTLESGAKNLISLRSGVVEFVIAKQLFSNMATPVADFTCNDSIICVGATVNFTDLSLNAPISWNWTFSGGTPNTSILQNPSVVYSTPGTYSVKLVVTNSSGSDSLTKTAYIVVSPLPTVTVSSAVQVCSGVPATISATGSPVGGTYLWQPGNNSAQSISVTPTGTTLYTVTYSTGCGSGATDTVSVLVSPVPVLTFSASISSGCPVFCTQFVARNEAANVTITSWDWSFGDGSSDSIQSPTHCYNAPGTYSVVLTAQSSAGCSSTYQAPNAIRVYAPPQAAFSYSPNPVTIDNPIVTFTDNSTGAYKIVQWFWKFGDNSDSSISQIENPQYTYTDTGTFCPRLVIVDIHGCTDSTTQCFSINSVYSFYIPSAFSPNGDGHNDVFMPQGTAFHNYEMYIYDRWGMQLFHTTNILEGWNGGVNNGSKICMEDSYVYVVNVTDNYGTTHHYTGALYLLK
jgi:gliding motility-associated-like protein